MTFTTIIANIVISSHRMRTTFAAFTVNSQTVNFLTVNYC